MISVHVSHQDTAVSIESEDSGYNPDVADDMVKHAVRAVYSAHRWLTGQAEQADQ